VLERYLILPKQAQNECTPSSQTQKCTKVTFISVKPAGTQKQVKTPEMLKEILLLAINFF